jgi:hypothetical protein
MICSSAFNSAFNRYFGFVFPVLLMKIRARKTVGQLKVARFREKVVMMRNLMRFTIFVCSPLALPRRLFHSFSYLRCVIVFSPPYLFHYLYLSNFHLLVLCATIFSFQISL